MQKGTISVQTENIFPIIKRFLYSDQEIFLRELVSNAIDATTKLRALSSRGEAVGELGDCTVEVILDEEKGTLTIRDKGIGMTEEETRKYLSEVAFSSAKEFLEKYSGDDANIIGHFGLGFYSAFMVASEVEVVTRSFRQDAAAVRWVCRGEPEYELHPSDKTARGTDVVLHIAEESREFLDKKRIEELLEKYCKFLPVEIQFGTRTETTYEGEGDDKTAITTEVPNIVNNPRPIWKKQPAELKPEDYKQFYQELYPYSPEPLFWIHLNIDYPFNLTGVLYFPQPERGVEMQRNKIQLYSNQVFVTDNVREIVPEFLTLLHGIIDSPDIPLNVSRSYLQADRSVKKITDYITRKVAEKLEELFRTDRPGFTEKWEAMKIFVKYGMLTEDNFFDRAKKFCLLENTENQFFTLDEYREKVKEHQTDKNDKVVYLYATNLHDQDLFIQGARGLGYDVLLFDQPLIDPHFMQKVEHSLEKTSFVRVDADTASHLIAKDTQADSVLSEADSKSLEGWFQGIMTDGMGRVETKALSPEEQPVVITKPEFMRRMREMYALQGQDMGFPDSYNLVVNTNHPVFAQKILKIEDEGKRNEALQYLYDLARLHQNMLKGSELTAFIKRSVDHI
jgi:molecular chaperone HtpG